MARPQRSEATPAVARARITGAHLLHSALFSISGSGRHPEAKEPLAGSEARGIPSR